MKSNGANMTDTAREVVARALHDRDTSLLDWDERDEGIREMWRSDADAALAALRPIIAAEAYDVMRYTDMTTHSRSSDDVVRYHAERVASRICGGGE